MVDCVFCKIDAGEIPGDKLHDDDVCFAIRDIYPVAPTHLLIIPHEHIVSLDEPHEAVIGHLFSVADRMARQEGVDGSGFRLDRQPGRGRRPDLPPRPRAPARRQEAALGRRHMSAVADSLVKLRSIIQSLPRGLQDHLERVRELSLELAAIHGVDPVKVETAALAHDLYRAHSEEQLLSEAKSQRAWS